MIDERDATQRVSIALGRGPDRSTRCGPRRAWAGDVFSVRCEPIDACRCAVCAYTALVIIQVAWGAASRPRVANVRGKRTPVAREGGSDFFRAAACTVTIVQSLSSGYALTYPDEIAQF